MVAVGAWMLTGLGGARRAQRRGGASPGAFVAAVLFFIRARAVRVPWTRLALDVIILAVGFGASF